MHTKRLVALGVLFVGCGRDTDRKHTETAPAPVVATVPKAQAAAPTATSASGTVLETMNSGGYTYAKLDDGTQQLWVAGPETPLTVGAKVGAITGTPMPGFRSETLNRTFDQLLFVDSLPVVGGAGPNPHGAAAPVEAMEKIEPVKDGKTVADVFANKDALAGKAIAIRGKVVKINTGILDRNWIHLQDGTGAPGTNDLMITTLETAAKGDVVVVHGKVATHRDFGAGYSYDVLVEDATLAK